MLFIGYERTFQIKTYTNQTFTIFKHKSFIYKKKIISTFRAHNRNAQASQFDPNKVHFIFLEGKEINLAMKGIPRQIPGDKDGE